MQHPVSPSCGSGTRFGLKRCLGEGKKPQEIMRWAWQGLLSERCRGADIIGSRACLHPDSSPAASRSGLPQKTQSGNNEKSSWMVSMLRLDKGDMRRGPGLNGVQQTRSLRCQEAIIRKGRPKCVLASSSYWFLGSSHQGFQPHPVIWEPIWAEEHSLQPLVLQESLSPLGAGQTAAFQGLPCQHLCWFNRKLAYGRESSSSIWF